jgi:hypothetical protein
MIQFTERSCSIAFAFSQSQLACEVRTWIGLIVGFIFTTFHCDVTVTRIDTIPELAYSQELFESP